MQQTHTFRYQEKKVLQVDDTAAFIAEYFLSFAGDLKQHHHQNFNINKTRN